MNFALVSRFHVINVKALVDAFNQENTLVGAFSSIVDRCSSSKHSGPIIESGASAARKLIELGWGGEYALRNIKIWIM